MGRLPLMRSAALALVAMLLASCMPEVTRTNTHYPLLTHQSGRPLGQDQFGGRVAIDAVPKIHSEAPQGTITTRYHDYGGIAQLGVSVGLGSRLNLNGDVLYGLTDGTPCAGLRAGPSIRVSRDSAEVSVAVQPSFVTLISRDHYDNSPTGNYSQSLKSGLTAWELRVPVSMKAGPRQDVTVAAGLSYLRYHTEYETDYPNYRQYDRETRNALSPLVTFSYRIAFVMLEVGGQLVGGRFQGAAGLAIGRW